MESLQTIKQQVLQFLRNVLYSTTLSNEEKERRFNLILTNIEQSRAMVSSNEKSYILSQIHGVSDIIQYMIPVVNEMCTRFLERYNTCPSVIHWDNRRYDRGAAVVKK